MDLVHQDPDNPEGTWEAERFEKAMEPFYQEYGELVFTPKPAATSGPSSNPPASAPGRSPTPSSTRRGTTSGPCRARSICRDPQEAEGPIVRVERISA